MTEIERNDTYVALDLETTGLNPKEDSIFEIGAVKVTDGKITDTYSTFVIPAKQLSERVTKLTGITEKDLEHAIEPWQAIANIIEFVGEAPLLGHSILFDFSFLKREAVNRKLSFEKKGIDTLRIARLFLPELPSKRLEDLTRHFQIRHRAHRALEDARAASELYEKLKEQFWTKETAAVFAPVPLIYKVKRETPATKHQKERLRELILMHGLNVDYDIEKLTRNQASRYTDKLLEKYGRKS
ncbi:MAG: 3'-5' exonuclease [Clostridiales bacterium]|nr:3'-5' exonuclease [Clostridiales bacterium]